MVRCRQRGALRLSARLDSNARQEIVKVHLKDFKRKEDGYAWVNLGDGDVDWAAVRQAFADIGYSGSVIAELEAGDEAYLRDVSQRIDRLLLGKS